jgi:hypothetical protein
MKSRAAPAVLLALLTGACFGRHYRENPRVAVVGGDPIVQMKPASKFPTVYDPRLVPVARHTDPPQALEKVVGVLVGSEPRAYPVGLLDRYEVVNDGGPRNPYVVVRCALTGVAAVYDRRVGGRTLGFANSGALWRDTLVLTDRETGTYWSAATGAALTGQLSGERLSGIPAVVTPATDWSRAYPGSLYFDMEKSTSTPLLLRLYGISPWEGVSGVRTLDRRRPPKEEVFTVAEGAEAIAFGREEIETSAPVEVTLGERRISIEWDSSVQAPRAFESGATRRERPLVPMYWFAVPRHFRWVRTVGSSAG